MNNKQNKDFRDLEINSIVIDLHEQKSCCKNLFFNFSKFLIDNRLSTSAVLEITRILDKEKNK